MESTAVVILNVKVHFVTYQTEHANKRITHCQIVRRIMLTKPLRIYASVNPVSKIRNVRVGSAA